MLFDSLKKFVFILGTALIVFTALRNSLVWHCQRFWGASGNFWQSQWGKIEDFAGESDFRWAIVAFIWSTAVFWIDNVFLIFLDVTGKPGVLLKYKVQEDKNVPVDPKRLKKAILQVLFNQIVIGFPIIYGGVCLHRLRGGVFVGELPTFPWVLFHIAVAVMVEEVAFYYSHRLLHHPRIYKYIHKQHHEWTAPIGIIALYAHPIEHAVSNMIPVFLGNLLIGSHFASALLWIALAETTTVISHSGFHFPLMSSPEAHDFHHHKFNQCYGVLGVLDRLHGTDDLFRKAIEYKRHITYVGTESIKERYPDTKKSHKCQ